MKVSRGLLFGYAAYAVPAGVALWRDDGVLADLGAGSALLAGVASLILGLRFEHAGARRQVIALHAVLIPAQFVLSVPSDIPLLGMGISIALLACMRPTFARLRPRARKFFLTLHIGLSVGWLGVALTMTVLAVTGLTTADRGLRHDVYRIMHLFDLTIVIPIALLAILSGLIMSLFTHWGLTRHWWVLTKFALTISIPFVAGIQHLWISDLIARTATDPQARPGTLGLQLLVCFLGYDSALITATVLSVYKPGRTTPWTRRTPPRRHPARQVTDHES